MSSHIAALAQSMMQAREHIMFDVLKRTNPAWWTKYRNGKWKRADYLRRRRGW